LPFIKIQNKSNLIWDKKNKEIIVIIYTFCIYFIK